MLGVEREEQHPLPRPEAEAACLERNRLRPRAEEAGDDALAHPGLAGDEALEQHLKILEETGLALLDPDDARRGHRVDVRDPVRAAVERERLRHVGRDVHDRQRRQRRRDRVRNLDARHARVTSLGSRKWTSSRATEIYSSVSLASSASSEATACTSASGVDAPAVSPIVSCPSIS